MKKIKKFYCQKVLPLVYDDSLSYYEVLCKLRTVINEAIETLNEQAQEIENINEKDNEQDNRIQVLEINDETQDNRLESAENSISELDVNVTELTSEIGLLSGRMQTAEDNIGGLTAATSALLGDVNNLESRVGDVEENIEELDDNKVDKIPNTGSVYKAYCEYNGNTILRTATGTPTPYQLVLYNANGILKSGTPSDNNDCATKEYVDNKRSFITVTDFVEIIEGGTKILTIEGYHINLGQIKSLMVINTSEGKYRDMGYDYFEITHGQVSGEPYTNITIHFDTSISAPAQITICADVTNE